MKTISGTQIDILDDYFQTSFAESHAGVALNLINNPYAIIAKGNYGRKEIYGQNDINILFIFSTCIPEKANGLIRDIIYPLWDLGLKINYSTRTVEECIKYAKKDYEYLLSVLDSRFVCGASLLFSQLITNIREKIVFNHKKEITAWQFEQDKSRHQKHTDNQFILEPDLIFSKGGLKDYHSIFSVAKLNLNIIELSEIVSSKLLSSEEYETLKDSIQYIRKVVIFLTLTSGRNSRLLVKNQHAAAKFMEYKNHGKRACIDIFLSDLYGHMKNIGKIHNQFFLSISPKSFAIKKTGNNLEVIESKWICSTRGLISFKSPKKIVEKPERLLSIFIQSEKNDMPLNSEAKRLINKYSYLLTEPSADSKKTAKLLEKNLFLSKTDSSIPFEMLDSGILTALIPEFSFAVNKKKAGSYYIHSLCHHLLLTVQKLKKLLDKNKELQTGIFQINASEEDNLSVFWAGLLHDIRQDLVREILKRFGKQPEFIEEVCFLTTNHNFLYNIISRKNICNSKTIKLCSAKFSTCNQLNKLYFLTIAEMKATGPLAFNDYKIKDLTELYQSNIEFRFNKNTKLDSIKAKTDYLLQICDFHKMKKSVSFISGLEATEDSENFSTEELCLHLKINENTETGKISFFSEKTERIRTTTILSKTRSCSLAEIMAVFMENEINIYDYRSYSINGNICVFVFRIEKYRDTIFENEKWAKIKQKLYMATTTPSNRCENIYNPNNCKAITNHEVNDSTPLTQFSKIKITPLVAYKSYQIEYITKDSLIIMFNVINMLLLKGFEIVFFRKTEVSRGCLFIFHITDRQKKLTFSKAKKKLNFKISQLINK